MKQQPRGSKLFTKMVYDGLNRETKRYLAYDTDESSYSDADDVTGDTVLEQIETTYDASNMIQITNRQRYHTAVATQTGELQGPSGSDPKARVTYLASWHDGVGRGIASADYGTNGGSAFTRPNTIPSRSDTVLVTTSEYNSAGELSSTIDPADTETRYEQDDAGRQTKLIENYQPATSSSSSSSSSSGSGLPSSDTNRTTVTTYTSDGNVSTRVAWNDETSDQTTTYVYGTTLGDSEIATSHLLRAIEYPDKSEASDRVEYKYNRQAERSELKDQNGSIHAYDYDTLGRPVQDRVTTLASGVDGSVRRIGLSYEVRGLVENVTSHDNATVGQGTIVNDVEFAYNDFGQLTASSQSHSGAATGTTPKVQYSYATGSANTIRPTSITYPNSRQIDYSYGTSGGINDNTSRVEAIKDSGTSLAEYGYLGSSSIVKVDYVTPSIRYQLYDPSLSSNIYTGLDRFGRVVDSRWYNHSSSTDTDRIKYGYDRASNRIWRENAVAASSSKYFDELYSYDGLYRLQDMQRGQLANGNTNITNLQFHQNWSLDETGNWRRFREDDDGDGTWDLKQTRTANKVNEITNIGTENGSSSFSSLSSSSLSSMSSTSSLSSTSSMSSSSSSSSAGGSGWVTPSYDAAGNMTTLPQPADPEKGYSATYDAWNRLVEIVDDSTSNTVQQNEYDGLGRRVIQKAYTAGSLDQTRHYYYSAGWQALEERVDSSTDAERQFAWGLRYIDDLICRDRDTSDPLDGTLDETLYCLQDANWNVTGIANVSGTAQERYAYEAYGSPVFLDASFVELTASAFAWETLFAGYRWDDIVKLYHVRNRVHHPLLGTWTQRDPLDYLDGGNLSEYVNSAPPLYLDPLGLQAPATIGDPLGLSPRGLSMSPTGYWNGVFKKRHPGISRQDLRLLRRERLPRGCYGIVQCELGTKQHLASPERVPAKCFLSYDDAREKQKTMIREKKCCGEGQRNLEGKPAQPILYGMQWSHSSETPLPKGEDGSIQWPKGYKDLLRLYNFGAMTPESDPDEEEAIQWYTANRGGAGMKVLTHSFETFASPSGYNRVAYCVACESTDVREDVKHSTDIMGSGPNGPENTDILRAETRRAKLARRFRSFLPKR